MSNTIDITSDLDSDGAPYGVSAAEVMRELRAADGGDVLVNLHSGGGSLVEGIAIFKALKNHPGRVTVRIDGLAASAASVVAMAGDRIEIASSAWMMIHAPSSYTTGGSMDFREMADLLDRNAGVMVSIYSERSGKPRREIEKMLAAETWMTGDEAVAAGFADAVFDGKRIAASTAKSVPASARWRRAVTNCGSAYKAAKRYPNLRHRMVAEYNQKRN